MQPQPGQTVLNSSTQQQVTNLLLLLPLGALLGLYDASISSSEPISTSSTSLSSSSGAAAALFRVLLRGIGARESGPTRNVYWGLKLCVIIFFVS
jgi:heme A synthase